MATLTYHRKKNGTTYVYHQESYWDKEKKRSMTKQVCIGKLGENDEIIYNKKYSKPEAREALENGVRVTESTCTGQSLVLDAAAKNVGLDKVVRAVFAPGVADALLSIAYAVVAGDGKMYHAGIWMEDHDCPSHEKPLSSQDISRLFSGAINQADIEDFLAAWMQRCRRNGTEQYCYDITSVSSHCKGNEFVEWGYNRDKEKMAQINIALVSGAKSLIPTFYQILPGSLNDVRTVCELDAHLKKLGSGRLDFLLDRGFYSHANITSLLEGHHGFLIPLPSTINIEHELIDGMRDSIEVPENIISLNDTRTEALYGATKLAKFEGRRVWYHVYYDTATRSAHILNFFEKLDKWEAEIRSGKRNQNHEKYYAKYFDIKTTPKRGLQVKRKQALIDEYKSSYAGYWVLLTNREKDAACALEAYRQRNSVECHFDDLKNELDMNRMRTHSARTMEGRVFVQFLSLILLEEIRNTLNLGKDKLSCSFTVSEAMMRLGSYRKTTFAGRYGEVTSTPTKAQRELFAAFGLDIT